MRLDRECGCAADALLRGRTTGVRVREVRYASTGDVMLAGTVWYLEDLKSQAGVVLIGGSGPTERSNGGYFDVLRDHLVAAGIAVLGYDKRGVGRSSGSWASATVDALAADAAAAMAALRSQPMVDEDAVGLFGHSEGGWVALRCAARGRPRWLIVGARPGRELLRCRGACTERGRGR